MVVWWLCAQPLAEQWGHARSSHSYGLMSRTWWVGKSLLHPRPPCFLAFLNLGIFMVLKHGRAVVPNLIHDSPVGLEFGARRFPRMHSACSLIHNVISHAPDETQAGHIVRTFSA